MSIEAHPVADIFPLMSDDEMTGLIEDIRSNGLREPIWLHPDGRIIDGRNRYRACVEGAVKPTFRTWSGEGSLVDFVVSLNLHRRHLSKSQKALVALEIEKQYAAEAKERMLAGVKREPKDPGEILPQGSEDRGPRARDLAAAAVGVSGRTVQDAKKVAAEAPQFIPKIESGEMTLNEAKTRIANPNAAPRRLKRSSLPDAAQKAGWDLRKAVERVERIVNDDRFPSNRRQVAGHLHGHLTHAIETCTGLVDHINHHPRKES